MSIDRKERWHKTCARGGVSFDSERDATLLQGKCYGFEIQGRNSFVRRRDIEEGGGKGDVEVTTDDPFQKAYDVFLIYKRE